MKLSKALEYIPTKYHTLLNKVMYCPDCKTELEVSDNLTRLYCPNNQCGNKIASRFYSAIEVFNLKGVGGITTQNYVSALNYETVVDALQSDLTGEYFKQWAATPHHPGDILAMLALPGLSNATATKIFETVNSWEELIDLPENIRFHVFASQIRANMSERLEEIWKLGQDKEFRQKFGWDFFMELTQRFYRTTYPNIHSFEEWDRELDITTLQLKLLPALGGTGTAALNAATTIYENREEISKMFSICKATPGIAQNLIIAITGDIRKVISATTNQAFERKQFVDYLNNLVYKYNIRVKNGKALESCRYVVADYPTTSRTYCAGLRRNNIISSLDLLKGLEQTYHIPKEDINKLFKEV